MLKLLTATVIGAASAAEWKLLVKHDSTSNQYFPRETKKTLSYRSGNGKLIMDLNQDYSQFRGTDGKMTFKLVYPEFTNTRQFPKAKGQTDLVWKQSSSPLEKSVQGYSIKKNTRHDWDGGDDFKGICLSSYGGTVIDGQPEHGYWFYAIGAHQSWPNARHFPGPRGSQKTAYGFHNEAAVQQMKLYVLVPEKAKPIKVLALSNGDTLQRFSNKHLDLTGGHTRAHATQANFCAMQGGRLPTFADVCPNGQGGQPAMGCVAAADHSWVPYSKNANSYAFISCGGHGGVSCKDHVSYHGNPNWGNKGDVYGSQVECIIPRKFNKVGNFECRHDHLGPEKWLYVGLTTHNGGFPQSKVNPGTTREGRIGACAKACSDSDPKFLGFVMYMKPGSPYQYSCICEYQNSATCVKDGQHDGPNMGYERWDFKTQVVKTKSPTESPTKNPTKAPTTSPTKAPTASPTVTPHFTLKAGSKGVEVNEHGCITDGPGAYAANELAQITVNFDGMLDVIHFKTHDEYRVWNNGWTTMTYAQLYGGGNTKSPWWMNQNSAYYIGSYPNYYRNLAVGRGYEQYASGDSGAIARKGSYRSYSKNGWYNDNWYFTDYLQVNGQRYHGPDSPDGVRVKAGTKMTWTTDGSHQEAGFIICLDTNPPPVPKPVFKIRNFNGQDGVKLTAQGCFTDGYGFYRSGEYSHIKVLESGVLFARHFSTEKRYDTLTINGHQYSGDDQVNGNSPDGVAVTAGSTIVWKSDHQMIRSGFIICLGSQEEHDCQAKNCAQWTCNEWCKCFDQKSEDNGEYQHFGCVDDNEETCDCPLNA